MAEEDSVSKKALEWALMLMAIVQGIRATNTSPRLSFWTWGDVGRIAGNMLENILMNLWYMILYLFAAIIIVSLWEKFFPKKT